MTVGRGIAVLVGQLALIGSGLLVMVLLVTGCTAPNVQAQGASDRDAADTDTSKSPFAVVSAPPEPGWYRFAEKPRYRIHFGAHGSISAENVCLGSGASWSWFDAREPAELVLNPGGWGAACGLRTPPTVFHSWVRGADGAFTTVDERTGRTWHLVGPIAAEPAGEPPYGLWRASVPGSRFERNGEEGSR